MEPRPSAIACGSDGYVYVLNAAENRIVRFTQEGRVVSEIATRPAGARVARLGDQFAVSDGYIFLMDGDGLTLHILSSDGKPKLDAELGPPGWVSQNRFIPAPWPSARDTSYSCWTHRIRAYFALSHSTSDISCKPVPPVIAPACTP